MKAYITGTGSYIPKNKIDNHTLATQLSIEPDWIYKNTGINSRYYAAPDETTATLAQNAVQHLLQQTAYSTEDIDAIIFSNVLGDYFFPGTGSLLQAALTSNPIPIFEIRQQCAGFLYGLFMADSFLKQQSFNHILLCCSELLSRSLQMESEAKEISGLFGDGAAAVWISNQPNEDRINLRLEDVRLFAKGSFAELLYCPSPGTSNGGTSLSKEHIENNQHFAKMNGKGLILQYIRRVTQAIKELLAIHEVTVSDIRLFIFHQANLRIIEWIQKELHIADESVYNTISKFGNTSSSSIGICLDHVLSESILQTGDKVILAGLGAGLNWGTAL